MRRWLIGGIIGGIVSIILSIYFFICESNAIGFDGIDCAMPLLPGFIIAMFMPITSTTTTIITANLVIFFIIGAVIGLIFSGKRPKEANEK